MENNSTELIAGIVSILAVAVTIITALSNSRNSAYNNLLLVVEQLRKDLERNDKKLVELEARIKEYETHNHALITQLTVHGITPVDSPH